MWRRAVVTSSLILAMLITGAGLLPPLLVNTAWRNRILSGATGQPSWTVVSEKATGGWLAPFVFHNVRITDDAGRLECTIRELQTSQGLLGFLTGGDDIGTLTLIEPRAEVQIGEDGSWPEFGQQASRSTFRYELSSAAIRVNVPWRSVPIVDVDNLKVRGHVGPDEQGRRCLFAEGTQVFDREALSEAHCQQNLALIAPVLSQSTKISGSASVWIDPLCLPLEGATASPPLIRGRAEFHSLNASLRDDWAQQLAALTGALAGTELPNRVEVLKDSKVEFAITGQGIDHQGMVFLLPGIAKEMSVASSGRIGLDEKLDLLLTVSLPKVLPAGGAFFSLLAGFAEKPVQLAVRGTVAKPELKLPDGFNLLGELTRRVAPAGFEQTDASGQSDIPNVADGPGNGLNPDPGASSSTGTPGEMAGNILNLIQAIGQQARQKAEAQEPGRPKPDASERKARRRARRYRQ